MNATTPNNDAHAEDNLHPLLQDFFRGEMSKCTFSPPSVTRSELSRMPQQRPTMVRGRVILAVSVLAVLGGLWFLVGNRPAGYVNTDPINVGDKKAENSNPFRPAHPAKPSLPPSH
jgi:hypothetical protein